MNKTHIKCHSYGAGVQSIAILYKYIKGEIERPDVVVFADTKAEPLDVYKKVWRDKEVCEKNGIKFDIISYGDLSVAPKEKNQFFLPLFVKKTDGEVGMMFRTCTERYKIQPIKRHLRKTLGAKTVEMWLGISTDEASRMKDSKVKYMKNRYPLIDLMMSRKDCEKYLSSIGVEASKSACVFCPYRNAGGWNKIRSVEQDWKQAVEYDNMIRYMRSGVGITLSVHRSGLPLSEAIGGDTQQGNLFTNECEGYCGL